MAVKFLQNDKRQQPVHGTDREGLNLPISGQMVIGLLFLVALIAFEIFNFDTTQFALESFLGSASFAGLGWATVLAIAFCAIDFAGLLRFFLPEAEDNEMPKEVWYLMGAWLLGATMNALMTWWAVSLTLLDHELGNEILSRAQILEVVPVFVAVLVWLTRILFIGAFTVAGGYLFDFDLLRPNQGQKQQKRAGKPVPATLRPMRQPQSRRPQAPLPSGLRRVKAVKTVVTNVDREEANEERTEEAPANKPRSLKPRPQRLPRPSASDSGAHRVPMSAQARRDRGVEGRRDR